MRVTTDPSQPVMAGMPKDADIFVFGSPGVRDHGGIRRRGARDVSERGIAAAIGLPARREVSEGKAAALDARLGDGHVILLGFRPQWRGQPFGSFRVLFNSIICK